MKSHIIPLSMFRVILDQDPNAKIYSHNHPYPKRSPKGEYDKNILCESCEASFTQWDDYAKRLLLQKYSDENYWIGKDGTKLAYLLKDIDYSILKLFFLSLLWRMAVSDREMFSKVQLGPFLDILEKHIINKNPGNPDEFDIMLAKYNDELGQNILMDPHKQRFFGVNYVQMYFAGYIAYVKVDSRETPQRIGHVSLRPNSDFPIILRSFIESKEFLVVASIIKKFPAPLSE